MKPAANPKTQSLHRLYVIGDIHGCHEKLVNLQTKIQADAQSYNGKTTLIYLGDYTDRGLQNQAVLENLSTPLEGFNDVKYLMGNHDLRLLHLLQNKTKQDPQGFQNWLHLHGGSATLQDYGIKITTNSHLEDLSHQLQNAMPPHHQTFLENLEPYLIYGEFLLTHGGINPNLPLKDHDILTLTHARPPAFANHNWPHIIVCGHTIVKNPVFTNKYIALDTGAYTGASLTCGILTLGQGAENIRLLQA